MKCHQTFANARETVTRDQRLARKSPFSNHHKEATARRMQMQLDHVNGLIDGYGKTWGLRRILHRLILERRLTDAERSELKACVTQHVRHLKMGKAKGQFDFRRLRFWTDEMGAKYRKLKAFNKTEELSRAFHTGDAESGEEAREAARDEWEIDAQ